MKTHPPVPSHVGLGGGGLGAGSNRGQPHLHKGSEDVGVPGPQDRSFLGQQLHLFICSP